ncbi:MAG: ATP-binding cassette domain-containing protein, partial [Alphaproteobacteria bacterium]|nr:ATP-binding cassette domain-containing protein [Alphaproteobacteria bacterium]
LRSARRHMQMVFQDPFASLNPRLRVGEIIAEGMAALGIDTESARHAAAIAALLHQVGLPDEAAGRYPHEFSGGQRQRVGIARALSVEPELLVADEPVSALDVSIQAQVLLLLRGLQERRGLSFVFVSHDLGVVRWFCQSVAVMYLGRIVEQGPLPGLFDEPLHPYTQALRAASPVPDPRARVAMARIEGVVPSATAPPPGCHFHPRCPHASERCRVEYPAWKELGGGRGVACHLFDK